MSKYRKKRVIPAIVVAKKQKTRYLTLYVCRLLRYYYLLATRLVNIHCFRDFTNFCFEIRECLIFEQGELVLEVDTDY